MQAWKKCRSRDLGSDKTADFGIKFGENAILVRVSRIKFTFWGINRIIFSKSCPLFTVVAQCKKIFWVVSIYKNMEG